MISTTRRYASNGARSAAGATLGLDWFIQRSRVLGLWRDMLKTIRRIEDPAAKDEMRTWARHEFKRNKEVRDTTQIRYLISQGKHDMDTIIKCMPLKDN
ncbi:hypothetical protein DRE_07330 [Drechslerella stenobrocha 248]|uniref:LYR motif-containing protein 2 n=1 Tax=Drechslerella stenobrocha 248 TaxID=1043628 RepID=W7HIS9_9PEZI|nr:hypothetical protein DRE_07330 [Drechslerella stenobrocha 248]